MYIMHAVKSSLDTDISHSTNNDNAMVKNEIVVILSVRMQRNSSYITTGKLDYIVLKQP